MLVDYHIKMIFREKKNNQRYSHLLWIFIFKKLVQVFFKICHKSSFCQIKLFKMINTKPRLHFQLDIMTWIRYPFVFNILFHKNEFFSIHAQVIQLFIYFFPPKKSWYPKSCDWWKAKVTWSAKDKKFTNPIWRQVKNSKNLLTQGVGPLLSKTFIKI